MQKKHTFTIVCDAALEFCPDERIQQAEKMVKAASETACQNDKFVFVSIIETGKRQLRVRFVFFDGELTDLDVESAYPFPRVGADTVAIADKNRRNESCGAAGIGAMVNAIYSAIDCCGLKP